MSDRTPSSLSNHSRSSITLSTPPHPTRSAEWEDAAMVLVGIFSASGACQCLFQMILSTSPSMLRRVWTKDWPSIVVTLGISWAYAITALSINPHYIHGLWLLFFRVVLPTVMYAIDAMAVYIHLRTHPKKFEDRFGTEDKAGKKKNSGGIVSVFFTFFVVLAIDISRHYLLVELSEDVNLVTLNITNPFNNRPVTFNNVDLATALFWGATIFMAQSMWVMLTKKALRETVTDITHYKVVLKTSEDEADRA